MNERLFEIPVVPDENLPQGVVELHDEGKVVGKIVNMDKALSPRESFLRGLFASWGYSKTKAAAAASAAMEKLS